MRLNNIDLSSLRNVADSKKEVSPNKVEQHSCAECGSTFQREGNLKNHIASKHPVVESVKEDRNQSVITKNQVCKLCSAPFGSNLALESHMKKKHRTCSICKTVFNEPEEMEVCRAKHTTCGICKFNAKFPSKLDRHMMSHR